MGRLKSDKSDGITDWRKVSASDVDEDIIACNDYFFYNKMFAPR